MEKHDLAKIKLFLFDLDGTLYLGDRLYPFTAPLLKALTDTGRKYLFLTNNSSRSVADYVRKLNRLGIAARQEDFLTSSQATAHYLLRHHKDKPLYVCGTASLIRELEEAGLSVTFRPEEAQCVVMGFDTELTFEKLRNVSMLLSTRKDIPYIATNPDLVCPTEFGSVPDCGSICMAIRNATGRMPVVIGKPQPLMVELAMAQMGTTPAETAVVGDRIYTDVECGLNAGIAAILVMSGETTPEILAAASRKPSLVLRDCGEISEFLR